MTPIQPSFAIQFNTRVLQWEIVSWDSRRQDYTIQNTSLPSH